MLLDLVVLFIHNSKFESWRLFWFSSLLGLLIYTISLVFITESGTVFPALLSQGIGTFLCPSSPLGAEGAIEKKVFP